MKAIQSYRYIPNAKLCIKINMTFTFSTRIALYNIESNEGNFFLASFLKNKKNFIENKKFTKNA